MYVNRRACHRTLASIQLDGISVLILHHNWFSVFNTSPPTIGSGPPTQSMYLSPCWTLLNFGVSSQIFANFACPCICKAIDCSMYLLQVILWIHTDTVHTPYILCTSIQSAAHSLMGEGTANGCLASPLPLLPTFSNLNEERYRHIAFGTGATHPELDVLHTYVHSIFQSMESFNQSPRKQRVVYTWRCEALVSERRACIKLRFRDFCLFAQ